MRHVSASTRASSWSDCSGRESTWVSMTSKFPCIVATRKSGRSASALLDFCAEVRVRSSGAEGRGVKRQLEPSEVVRVA
eukprot:2444419-Rhodomonas_salina.4